MSDIASPAGAGPAGRAGAVAAPARLLIASFAAGAAAAGLVAFAARRARSLSASGAIAATVLGATAVAAGWGWGALLVGYFVSSSLWSRAGAVRKAARTGAIVEKGGARDAWQVLANGGVFGAAAIATIASGAPVWAVIGAGALAASAADTWATEIGTWVGGEPRSILTGRRVPTGTSGGVSGWGLAGSLLGAAAVAAFAIACGWPSRAILPIVIGGIVGSLADSLLGATVQSRRRCPTCDRATERRIHDCGTATRPDGGWEWLDNDAVNFASCLAGALAGGWAGRVLGAIS